MSNNTTTGLSHTTATITTDVTKYTNVINDFTETPTWTSESQPDPTTDPEEASTRVTELESTTVDSTTTEVAQTTTGYRPTDGSESGSLKDGEIVGIVVGSIAAVLIIVFLCYCCYRSMKKRKQTQAQPMKPFKHRMREQIEKALRRFTHYESRPPQTDPDSDSEPGSPPPTVELTDILAYAKETESSVHSAEDIRRTPEPESTAEVHHEPVTVDVAENTPVGKPELPPRVIAAVVTDQVHSEQTAGKPHGDYENLPAKKHPQSSTPVPSPGYEQNDDNDNEVLTAESADQPKEEPPYENLPISGTLERDTRDREPVNYNPVEEVREASGQTEDLTDNETVQDKGKHIYANVGPDGEHNTGQENEAFTHEPPLDNGRNENDETGTQVSASMPNLQVQNPHYANLPVARPRLGRTPSQSRSTLEPNYYNVEDEIKTLQRKC